jgi:hypothetical protein
MKLYLIKRTSDGAFLRKIEGHYSAHTGQDKNAWSETPAYMLRTPDGIAKNLRKLCSTPFYPKGDWSKELCWKDFDADRLSQFEIVCMDVDIVSMTATPATAFAQVSAIEAAPITRAERWAE